jgi:cytidine deaminase
MIAHGYDWADVRGAVLGTVIGGAVDYRASTAEVLARCAPEVALRIAGWRT